MTDDIDEDALNRTVVFRRDRVAEVTGAAAADAVGHYLVMLEGFTPAKRIEIRAEPITFGRGAAATNVYADNELSRVHMRVLLVNGVVTVEDLQSTNGTFVNGEQISGAVTIEEGARVQIGGQVFKYESRSRADVKKAEELEKELKKANTYVLSLLPPPITEGPVRTAWRFVPSTQLGGDAFGYYWLDADTFVFYLMDVSGHGVGAAMHSVSVLNVLRQRALPQVDFTNPGQVFASLNDRFSSDAHGGLYFTMWYGVYRTSDRSLTYGTAGHGPAFLVPTDRSEAVSVGSPAIMIGLLPNQKYDVLQTTVPPWSTLYVFSDGAYEIQTKDDQQWDLSNFVPLLIAPTVPGTTEPDRIYQAVKHVAAPGPLDDDFSLMALTFV